MKKYEYQEIESGTSLSPGLAIAQAVHMLELASEMATDARDVDRIVKISGKWLNMGVQLAEIMAPSEEDDEAEAEEQTPKMPFGFNGGTNKQIVEKGVTEDGGESSGDQH